MAETLLVSRTRTLKGLSQPLFFASVLFTFFVASPFPPATNVQNFPPKFKIPSYFFLSVIFLAPPRSSSPKEMQQQQQPPKKDAQVCTHERRKAPKMEDGVGRTRAKNVKMLDGATARLAGCAPRKQLKEPCW